MTSIKANSLLLFYAVFLILLVSSLFGKFFPGNIDGFGDELCCLFVMLLIFFKAVKRPIVSREMKPVLIFFAIALCFGICGNVFFHYVTSASCVVRDMFFTYKPYIFLLFGLLYVKNNNEKFFRFVQNISKIMICLISFMSIIDHFVDLGLKKNGGFTFFSTGTSSGIAWWLILFVSLVFMGGGKRFVYLFLAAIPLIFIDSGLGNFSLAMTIPVYFLVEKRKKIKMRYLVLIIPIGLYLAGTEINSYLMNDSAPRYIMHKYAFITAKDCFPFGSGFGTFGGNTAIDYYSPLYYKYGFSNMYGMSPENPSFLMDSYYPMIIAQFGYVGLFAFIFMIVKILRKQMFAIENKKIRIWLTFLFGVWLAAGLGFGTGSNWGCCVFFLIGVLSKNGSEQNAQNQPRYNLCTTII